jgi:hypothetical protein
MGCAKEGLVMRAGSGGRRVCLSVRSALVAGLCLLGAAGAADAQVFLRGDANADGRVSGSDAHAILSYLFRGGVGPSCLRSGDVNADDRLNITDAIRLLNFLVLGGVGPCDPFPEPGADPQTGLRCDAYVPGPPLEDAAAALRVANAIAGPDGQTVLNLFVSSSVELAGYFAELSIAGARFGAASQVIDLSETLAGGFIAAQVFDGRMRIGFLSSLVGGSSIPAGDDRPVTQIRACLEPNTPAGDYDMVFESAELTDFKSGRAIIPETAGDILAVPERLGNTGCVSPGAPALVRGCERPAPPPPPPPPPDGPTLDFARGDVNLDGRVSISDSMRLRRFLFNGGDFPPCLDAADTNDDGSINVTDIIFVLNHVHLGGPPPPAPFLASGPDPTPDGLGCDADEVVPPPQTREDIVALGEVEGIAGGLVEVPVFLTNAEEVEAFQLVIRFDPAFFRPARGSGAGGGGLAFGRSFYAGKELQGFISARTLAGHDDLLAVGFIPHFIETGLEVPPGKETLVFSIIGQVPLGVAPGTESEIAPTDGPAGEGFGDVMLRNELTSRGATRLPLPVPGMIRITEGIAILRGDADHSGRVNISDASAILTFLFLGGAGPRCADEADANDDGKVNIADPIAILGHFFLGAAPLAPPFPEVGLDPTADGLAECR